MASHVPSRPRSCLAPAAVECQVTTPSPRGQTRVVVHRRKRWIRPETAPYTDHLSGPTGGCWVTHWAISWPTTPSCLTATASQTHRTNPTVRRLPRAEVCQPDDRAADREWPGRGRSGGAVAGAAPVSTSNRVRRASRCGGPFRNRPAIRFGGHKRVARSGAAGASRHPSRVRRVRHITGGCTERRRVSLAGARAAARRGVHFLARTLRAGVDRSAGGAAGALHCLSALAQFRW